MNAGMRIPSRASAQSNRVVEGVETMHSLPHPAFGQKGKDMVRSVGNQNRQRPVEMTSPPCLSGHGLQVTDCKDLYDELVAGVGTYNITEGPTATVFKTGFTLPIANVEVYEDGNVAIDSSDDAKGGVFAKEGIVLVQGKAPWRESRREAHIGGGADSVFLYDELTRRLAA